MVTRAPFWMVAVRVSGVYFLLLTLALGLVVWGVCLRWSQVTGGENGLRGDLRTGALADPATFYALVLVISLCAFFAMRRFVNSPFGLTLRGIRDSESRMASMGYIPPPFHSMRKIFYYEKNYPLYAVGLFSRHQLAYKLWDDALKYTDDQLKFPGM